MYAVLFFSPILMPNAEDSLWSFKLRSYNPRDFSEPDPDYVPVDNDNPCSDGSTLVDHPLSEDNDTAVFKPNPWSIARINAASRVDQKSQQQNDGVSLNRTIVKCDKKQTQGRIVDLLKKQAQQPSLDAGSGLRPSDTPLSTSAKKLSSHPKRPSPPHSGTMAPTNRRPSGYLENTVEATRPLPSASRDGPHSLAAGRVSCTKAAISTTPSDTSTDSRQEYVVQGSTTTRSGGLSQPTKALTRAAVGRSAWLPTDAVDPRHSGGARREAILSQHQAYPASPSTYGKQCLGWLDHLADPSCTYLTQAIPAQTSITFTPRPYPTSTYGCGAPVVEAIQDHRIVEKRTPHLSAATVPNTVPPTQPIPAGPAAPPWPDLPLPTDQGMLVFIYSCLHDDCSSNRPPAEPQLLPVFSKTQPEPETPPKSDPIQCQTLSPMLPTPQFVDTSRPAPRRTWRSAYDHPALQSHTEDDSEWSTLPRRKPAPRQQQKNLVTTSAKFRLPICSRGVPQPTDSDEERTRKRPRITVYRPPSRTTTVDLAGLQSRYKCVRGATRKVHTLGIPTLDPYLSSDVHDDEG
ncbi:hypothetical protein BC826DRAFT_1188872 [Russula brevipes]|nr:hypothetical protein BC826DRAFT_1188872 [Russula brevipes]